MLEPHRPAKQRAVNHYRVIFALFTAQVDAGPTDAMATTPDAQPQLDAGSVLMYGEPWLDAGAVDDYGVPPVEPDAGDIDLYGVPPGPSVDGGFDTLYSAPGCEPEEPEEDR